MVLLQLVEYLGHSNPIISGVAYNEVWSPRKCDGSDINRLQILRLAKANDMSVERMFSAFWANIAIVPVKDLLVRPQTSQLMADLMEMTVPDFLKLTQTYTLPYLVLTKKVDIINRIAQARKETEPWETCVDPVNLTSILPLLLVQNVTDMETFILSLFKGISPQFQDLDLTDLLRTEPASTALQLLKAAGQADDSKKSRVGDSQLSKFKR